METMHRSLRVALVLALLAAAAVAGGAAATVAGQDDPHVAVGRVVDIEVHHSYVVVEFANGGRMNVGMDRREMGQYAVGDEIRIDTFGRPLPKLGGGPRPPSDGRRAP
jgi:hypothetical protein